MGTENVVYVYKRKVLCLKIRKSCLKLQGWQHWGHYGEWNKYVTEDKYDFTHIRHLEHLNPMNMRVKLVCIRV